MLRRAGFAHRQRLEQAPIGRTTLWNFRTPSFPPRTSISVVRCLPAAALATRPSTLRSSLSGIHISDLTPAVTAGQGVQQKTPLETPFSANLLSILSRGLAETVLREEILAIPSLSEHLLDNTKARQLAETIALTPDYRLAVKVLHAAHILGCHLKQNAYECTAHHLSTKNHWSTVLSIVSLGKDHTERTTIRLLNWQIRALIETGQHSLLRSILEEFEKFQVKPNRRTFHLLISGHVRNRDLLGAKKMLRVMGQIGLPPDDTTHALIASYYRNLGPNAQIQDQALQSLTSLEGSTAVTVLNRLIQLRLDANDPAAALQLLSAFDQDQVGCITKVVSGVVSTPGGGNPFAQPLQDIPQLCLSADSDTFATVIHYMALRRDLRGALLIIESMLTANISPTSEVVTALINVYFATGHNGTAFRTVIDFCAKRPVDALASLERQGLYNPIAPLHFVATGIVPNTRMFNALLNGALSAHGLACARDVFAIMQANDIHPNEATIELLIAFVGKSQHARPRMLLRLLSKLDFPELRPTLRHLHILLSRVIRHEKYLTFGVGWNTTASLFSRTRQATLRVHPKPLLLENGTEPFDPIGGLPLEGKHWREAQPFVDKLRARKTNVDGVLIGMRLKREATVKMNMDAAQDIFDLLLARGIQPNEYHFSALMEGYTRKGDISSALDILEAAVRVGIKPNRVMYTILIVGYGRQGQPEEAVATFKRMVEANIPPDVASIDAVAGAFFAVGSYLMARRSLITLWPYVRPFPDELEHAPLKELATQFRLLEKDSHSNLSRSQWKKLYRRLWQLLVTWKASRSSDCIMSKVQKKN